MRVMILTVNRNNNKIQMNKIEYLFTLSCTKIDSMTFPTEYFAGLRENLRKSIKLGKKREPVP